MDNVKLVKWFEGRKVSLKNEFVRAVLNQAEEVQNKILAVVLDRDEALKILDQRLSEHGYDCTESPGARNILMMCRLTEGEQLPVYLVTPETFQRRRNEVIALFDPKIETLLKAREQKEKWARDFLATHMWLFDRGVIVGDVDYIRSVLRTCGIHEASIEAAQSLCASQ